MIREPRSLVVHPIGFVRSPFTEKVEAPRQAVLAAGTEGTIEILPEHRDALSDLDGFERIWVLFWFDRVPPGAVPSKVLPPRSDTKRGVFATRSPHRPNPIGMSAVRLVSVAGGVVTIRDLDLLDGTPVLDLKPYVAYADAFPAAGAGWLDAGADTRPAWQVVLSDKAEAQLAWLAEQGLALDLRARIVEALALGPQPHAYRRIKQESDGASVLAAKDWRARFTVEGRAMCVSEIFSGYRARELAGAASRPELALHAAFVERFR
ncbi:MAG: hypothetical protein JWP97_6687 [Labilithrix sp.]|nr:hypothetical protein [Labilithrix sp.]